MIELTSRAGEIIKQAAATARASQVPVGPEHVLLALVEDDFSGAGRVLHARGAATDIKNDVQAELANRQAGPEAREVPEQKGVLADAGRRILEVAEEEARRMGASAMGTKHLLLALMKDERGVASQILRHRGIRTSDIEAIDSEHEPTTTGMTVPSTPRTQRVLEVAEDEARRMGASAMGTKHLLLALMKDERGVASQILRHRGIRTSDIEAIDSEHEPITPGVFESAENEAQRMGAKAVGTEHLLLALVKDQRGAARQILRDRGIMPTEIEADVQAVFAPQERPAFPGHPQPWGTKVEHDRDGTPVINPDGSLRQYLVDSDGRPVLNAQGQRVNWKLDPNGDALLDETGQPLIEPID